MVPAPGAKKGARAIAREARSRAHGNRFAFPSADQCQDFIPSTFIAEARWAPREGGAEGDDIGRRHVIDSAGPGREF